MSELCCKFHYQSLSMDIRHKTWNTSGKCAIPFPLGKKIKVLNIICQNKKKTAFDSRDCMISKFLNQLSVVLERINRIYDGIEAETRKAQASFQITRGLPSMTNNLQMSLRFPSRGLSPNHSLFFLTHYAYKTEKPPCA